MRRLPAARCSRARGRASTSWLLAVCCILGASAAHADGMRCGSRLVSEGDYLYEVRERCGEPDAASQRVELRTVRSFVNGPCYQEQGQVRCGRMIERTIEVVIDEWVYDRGEHKFVRYLTFEQGRLANVRTGRYGSKDS